MPEPSREHTLAELERLRPQTGLFGQGDPVSDGDADDAEAWDEEE